jgi:hypothetical protein
MANTTSGLAIEKQSWSLIPASMLVAPISGAETPVMPMARNLRTGV